MAPLSRGQGVRVGEGMGVRVYRFPGCHSYAPTPVVFSEKRVSA